MVVGDPVFFVREKIARFDSNWKVYFNIQGQRFTKAHFYKNNANPPVVTKNLHNPVQYFGACLPEIWDRIVQIFCDNRWLCVILIKNEPYVYTKNQDLSLPQNSLVTWTLINGWVLLGRSYVYVNMSDIIIAAPSASSVSRHIIKMITTWIWQFLKYQIWN